MNPEFILPGAQRRKRDRASRPLARKPSGPDGPRPALEGKTK